MTNDEAILKFLVNFTDDNNDGTISKKQWDDYYATISARIERDDHFIQVITLVWK